jgi:hypothetical protein
MTTRRLRIPRPPQVQLVGRRHEETSRQPNSVRGPRNAWNAIKFWVSVFFLIIWFCNFWSFTSKYGLGHKKARKTRRPYNYKSRANLFNQDPFARGNYVYNITEGNILRQSDWIYSKNSGWDVAPIVIPEYNLLFFTVPKTGTTIFKQLFRRMMGFENWLLKDENLVHSPGENGLKYLYHYPPTEANEMLTSPNWTRAIFVRDPKNRILSAYLDKALHNHGDYVKRHCCGIKKQSPFWNAAAPPSNAGVSLGGENSLRDRHIQEHMKKGTSQGMRFPGRRLGEIAGDLGAPRDFRQSDNHAAPQTGLSQNRFGTTDSRAANAYLSYAIMGARDKFGPDPKFSGGQNGPEVVQGTRTGAGLSSTRDVPRIPAFCNSLGEWDSPVNATVFPFEKFVQEFMGDCDDPHWRPQAKRLPFKIWQYINFVGYFGTMEQDTQTLLKQLGAWEKYGATDWGAGGSVFSTNTALHKTSAGDQVNTYYTPRIEEMVMKHYAVDYSHPFLNFTGEDESDTTPQV